MPHIETFPGNFAAAEQICSPKKSRERNFLNRVFCLPVPPWNCDPVIVAIPGSEDAEKKVGEERNSRLRLRGHGLVQAEGIKRLGEVLVHVLVKVHAACRTLRVVLAVGAAGVAGGGRVARGAVRRHTGSGAHRVVSLGRGDRVRVVRVVVALVVALGGDWHGHGAGVVLGWRVGRHGGWLTGCLWWAEVWECGWVGGQAGR